MEVNESNYDTLQKVMDITDTDYEITWRDAENIKGYIDQSEIVDMLNDLLKVIERLNVKYEEFEEDVRENYQPKPFDPWEEYGISPNEFH